MSGNSQFVWESGVPPGNFLVIWEFPVTVHMSRRRSHHAGGKEEVTGDADQWAAFATGRSAKIPVHNSLGSCAKCDTKFTLAKFESVWITSCGHFVCNICIKTLKLERRVNHKETFLLTFLSIKINFDLGLSGDNDGIEFWSQFLDCPVCSIRVVKIRSFKDILNLLDISKHKKMDSV